MANPHDNPPSMITETHFQLLWSTSIVHLVTIAANYNPVPCDLVLYFFACPHPKSKCWLNRSTQLLDTYLLDSSQLKSQDSDFC